jgi:hypothetical protein
MAFKRAWTDLVRDHILKPMLQEMAHSFALSDNWQSLLLIAESARELILNLTARVAV